MFVHHLNIIIYTARIDIYFIILYIMPTVQTYSAIVLNIYLIFTLCYFKCQSNNLLFILKLAQINIVYFFS